MSKTLLASSVFALILCWGCVSPSRHADLKEDSSILTRRWVRPTHGLFEMGDHGTEHSNAIMVDQTLIFGNRSVGIIALYPKFNQESWSLKIRGGVMSELVAQQDKIYFGGGDGFLYCVQLEEGRILWKYELKNPIISRPTLDQGRVLVTTSDNSLYALDANTGKWLWHYRRRDLPLTTLYGASSPLVDGNEVLAGLSDGYLISVALEDGQLKWEKKLHTGGPFMNVNAHPVLEQGRIYIPSYDGALYALDRTHHQVIWRFDAGGSKNVVLDSEKLYLPSSNGSIYALHKNTAREIWRFQLDGGVPTELVMIDDYLVVGSSYQYLYVLNKHTGVGLYRFNAGSQSGFSGAPTWDSQTRSLYLLSGAGNLYAFSLNTVRSRSGIQALGAPYRLNSL